MLDIVRHIDHLVAGEAGVILRPPVCGVHPGVSHGQREGLSELPMVKKGQEKIICDHHLIEILKCSNQFDI